MTVAIVQHVAPPRLGEPQPVSRRTSADSFVSPKRSYRLKNRIPDFLAAEQPSWSREDDVPTVLALMGRLRVKDPYTWEHSHRVAGYARAMGKAFGMPMGDLWDLTVGAMLHDIGKLTVPAHLLRKTTDLSAAEWAVIARHTVAGEDLLTSTVVGRSSILAIVRMHHERVDGAGLPGCLGHREIPLPVRIVSAADAFDAMTSHRPYQLPVSQDTALAELERCTGTQFDQLCVSLLRAVTSAGAHHGPLAATIAW